MADPGGTCVERANAVPSALCPKGRRAVPFTKSVPNGDKDNQKDEEQREGAYLDPSTQIRTNPC